MIYDNFKTHLLIVTFIYINYVKFISLINK